MDNLRLILLIVGCLIILGIYLWEIFNSNSAKKRTDILNAVDETPDNPDSSISVSETGLKSYPAETLTDLGSLLTQSRNETIEQEEAFEPLNVSEPVSIIEDEEEPDLPLEMSVKDYEASMEENNRPDIFGAIEEDLNRREESNDEEGVSEEIIQAESINETDIPESNKTSGDILVLYITSPSHISFNGLSISKAADEVGMVYGHMNIFHHFGPGKLHSGQPLFSLANMHEPGSFDLGRMADLKTKGLAVFMYSPASIDANVVFELFLNTTQRLSSLLGGTVRTADNEVLNNAAINALREKAESFSVS